MAGLLGISSSGDSGSGYSAPMPRGFTAKPGGNGGGGQTKGIRAKRDIGMPSRHSFRKSGRGGR